MQRRFVNSAGNNGWSMSHDFLPFAPKTKRKGYSQNDSPQLQNESRAIVLLCTQRGQWVHFFCAVFEREIAPDIAETVVSRKTANPRMHLPFCSRNLQDKKKKDYNLVSKLQSLFAFIRLITKTFGFIQFFLVFSAFFEYNVYESHIFTG